MKDLATLDNITVLQEPDGAEEDVQLVLKNAVKYGPALGFEEEEIEELKDLATLDITVLQESVGAEKNKNPEASDAAEFIMARQVQSGRTCPRNQVKML